MFRKSGLIVFFFLLCSIPEKVAAQSVPAVAKTVSAAPAEARITVPNIQFEKYKLKNGLEVILSEDHRLPIVAVNIWYHVGPANERPGLTGFAHLFEHLMFEGSKHVGERAHFKYLEAAGATNINGTTEFDRTNYFETVPSNELEKALWLESDRMGFLLDTLDETKLASQRDVVRNERRQIVENAPYGLADEALFTALFPADHPYHAHVIGSHADIEAAQLADVREFFRRYYAPNNASLVIAGDIDKARARSLVDKYFGPLPSGSAVPAIKVKPPHIESERRIVVKDKVNAPRVYMAWITDPIFKPGDAAEQLLGRILAGYHSKSSRLYQRLVHDKQMAQDVQAEQYSLSLGSVFFIQVTAKQGVSPEKLEAAIDEELEAMRKEGPTRQELDRERNVIEARLLRRMDKLGGLGGVADRLNFYNQHVGDPGFLQKDIDRYERVTVNDVRVVAQQKLTRNSRVVVYCVPGEKVVQDVPKSARKADVPDPAPDPKRVAFEETQAWRGHPPHAGPPSTVTLPSPREFKLPNGLSVLLLEKHDLPLVSAILTVRGGSGANPPGQSGLAAFTAAMLEAGTTTRSSRQIALDADRDGTELQSTSDSDHSTVSINCLRQYLRPAFGLLSDIVLHPAFAPEEIERIRAQRISTLHQNNSSSPITATKVFQQLIYGKNHPYGYVDLGAEESLKAIQREDLVTFWKKTYLPSNAGLILTGDLTQQEAESLARKYFGDWKGEGQINPPPPVAETTGSRIVIVDRPGAAQSSVIVGELGITRLSPDYVPLDVLNTMFGGQFSSRLNMDLREKHGYSYGAFSQFTERRGTGTFLARAEVRTDVTGPAIGQMMEDLNGIKVHPFSEEELSDAKASLSRSLSVLFDTTARSAQTTSELFIYKLPLDYYATLPGSIAKVTTSEVAQLAVKYVHPTNMTIVVVGDRARIEPAIQQLHLGQIQVVDPEGKLQASR